MRKILITGLLSFLLISLHSQDLKEDLPGGRDRLVLDLNWNGWINTPDSINLKWYGRGINFYFMYDMPFGNSIFSLAPGVGLGTDNIYYDAVVQQDTMGITHLRPIPGVVPYKNNKINTTYLDVPIELRIRSRPNSKNKSFKLGIGFKAGILLASKTKYVGTGTTFGQLRPDSKIKEFRIPNINKFRYGFTFRVGYGPFNLKAFYSVATLFESGRGPAINALNIGISFNGL